MADGASDEALARLQTEVLTDLHAIQAHLQRLHFAASALRREQQSYEEKQDQLQADIELAGLDIEQRKQELEAARLELAQQQEYETVKQKVVSVPPRSATRAEISAVRREIADLKQQGADTAAAVERRKAQFASILRCLEDAAAAMDEEAAATEDEEAAGRDGAAPMQVG
jgi:chromosome segregation ATPase